MSKLFVILLCVYLAKTEKAASFVDPDSFMGEEKLTEAGAGLRGTSPTFVGMLPNMVQVSESTYTCDPLNPGVAFYVGNCSLYNPKVSSNCNSQDGGVSTSTFTVTYTPQSSGVRHVMWTQDYSCSGDMTLGANMPMTVTLTQSNDPQSFDSIVVRTDDTYSDADTKNFLCVSNDATAVTGDQLEQCKKMFYECYCAARASDMGHQIANQIDPEDYSAYMNQFVSP